MVLMKSSITIVFMLLIVYSLSFVYTQYLKIERFENMNEQDDKLNKSLQTTFEKFSLMEKKRSPKQ